MAFRRFHFAKLVADDSGWSYLKAYTRMNSAKRDYGISFREYYQLEFYKRPITTTQRKAQAFLTKKANDKEAISQVAEETGLTVEYLKEDKKNFAENKHHVGLNQYLDWQIYRLNDDERNALAKKFHQQCVYRADLTYQIAVSDRSTIDVPAYEKKLEEYKLFLKDFLPEHKIVALKEDLYEVVNSSELKDDEALAIILDMEMSRFIFGLSNKEYLMFRLWEKNLLEKLDYVPNSIHTGMMLYINGEELVNICNEKYRTYQVLKPFFNRDVIRITKASDYEPLKEFISKHDKGVFKPLTQTKGEGVRLVNFSEEVNVNKDSAIKQYAAQLYDEYGDYIFEELIIANDEFKKINPDAINTVRALVYNDGENVKIDGVLMRVGRMGSFVDNGSLGGILMNADPDTGIVRTLGADQAGHFYETHPDTGFKLFNYQIPAWDKAKKMLADAARTIGPGYVGWDITYDNHGDWVIVEANGTPQLYGIQSTTGKGALPRFIETVGDKAMEGFLQETRYRAYKEDFRAKHNGKYR